MWLVKYIVYGSVADLKSIDQVGLGWGEHNKFADWEQWGMEIVFESLNKAWNAQSLT